ncbi:MAG: hypothetical protein H0T42_26115 [Deltaproteobacteria bacterium]|nr:hypothetical protein [Deltaproteobacteria bacterium]
MLSLTFGRALLDVAAQWNTNENRGFVQFGLPSGVAFGAEWIRYRDAMTPSDLLGVFFGIEAPRSNE